MNVTLKKVIETAQKPEFAKGSNGILYFRAELINREQIVDKTDVIDIHSGWKVVIPDGYYGILAPSVETAGSSLISAVSPMIVRPGVETDIFIPFKLTTNAAPAIIRAHDEKADKDSEKAGGIFAVLSIVKAEDIELTFDEPAKTDEAPATDTTPATDTEAGKATDVAEGILEPEVVETESK